MAVYRFRVLLEDHDDFYRDIDILSNQSFEHFHNAILDSVKFTNDQMASFYVSDDFWRKGSELTLLDMTEDGTIPTMKDALLAKFIDDPHQRFIYTYDFLNMWTFYAELIKIIPDAEKGVKYPRVFKAIGESPTQNAPGKIAIRSTESIFEEELIEESELDDEDDSEEEKESDEFGSEFGSEDSEDKEF
ncbi:MAG: hypothetical protein WCK02_17005 [Bacteroidota bacterium]